MDSVPPAIPASSVDTRTFRFLLTCVRAVFDVEARHPPGESELAGVDWDLLPRLARENRVDVLLLKGLQHRGEAAIPATLLRSLFEYETANRRRNADSEEALIRIAGAFSAAKVDVLVFKGPLTARRFYPDPGLRFFWDLDFLVRPRDRAAFHDVLLACGYRRDGDFAPRERRLYEQYHFADSYQPASGTGPEIDLHWSLFPANFPLRMDEPGLWRRAADFPLDGTSLRTFSPVDAFIYTAMHGAKEEWRRLQMVADVAAMLTSAQAPDLPQCLARARAWGAQRHLLLALHLAQRLLGAPVPDALTGAIDADPVISELADDVLQRQGRLVERGTSIFDFSAWRSRSFDTRHARRRYAWRTMSMPRVEHLRLVPLPLPLAAYVPIRLLHDHVARPLRDWSRRARKAAAR